MDFHVGRIWWRAFKAAREGNLATVGNLVIRVAVAAA